MPSLLSPQTAETSRRARADWLRAAASLPLALGVQALMVAAVVLSASPPRPPSARAGSKPVSLRPINAARWASNRGAPRQALPERPAPTRPQGQVVDVAPGNERLPTDAKYVAETNNRVAKETRAREQVSEWSRATASTQANPTAAPSAKGVPREAPPVASGPSRFLSELGRRPLSLLEGPMTPGAAAEQAPDERGPLGTEAGTQAAVGGDASEGGGAPNDNLSQVPEGDGTFLNTREWRYAGFFNRVKQAVSARWHPTDRLRAKNKELGLVERYTVLHVTLRPDGSLADAFVAQPSGLDELDAEAVRAFEKAQPFPNPPQALVEQGGIRFAFSFTVTDTGGSGPVGGWRLVR